MMHSRVEKYYLKNCKQPKETAFVEYIWIDGMKGQHLRSKTRLIDRVPSSVECVPNWNFDGSATGQDIGNNADIHLKPVAMFKDPFLGDKNYLVLCETILFDGSPIESNTRNSCAQTMTKARLDEPWFGIEQEYSLLDLTTGRPFGWPTGETPVPTPDGAFYCGVEPGKVFGRSIATAHAKACLHAGIQISAFNAGMMLYQWSYQIGACAGINAGDHIWMSRYILYRVASEFNVGISMDPNIIQSAWSGAGAHTSFSTKTMRDKESGLRALEVAMIELWKRHDEHVEAYFPHDGGENTCKFVGPADAPTSDHSIWNVGQLNVSIRIPAQVIQDGCGYLEDRRPLSNCDPYLVCERLVKTVCLSE